MLLRHREADFVLVVTVRSMADYEALTKRLFFANNNVRRFRTLVAMDRVKVGLTVPLGRAEAGSPPTGPSGRGR